MSLTAATKTAKPNPPQQETAEVRNRFADLEEDSDADRIVLNGLSVIR